MVTTVGNEDTLAKRLNNLIELDYDAIGAYESAIERIDDTQSKDHLAEFLADHHKHTENLGEHLRAMGETVPTKGDAKGMLTKGKVVMADLLGDKAILQAMKSNEDDTNTAYEQAMAHDDMSAELKQTVQSNLEDERRHRQWIEQRISEL
jgi:uncharacterized protein (TIGR02284 family)